MTTCNTCGAELIANKRGVMYCKPCASKRGKSVRAKGNTYQREAAAFLTEHGLHTLNTGIGQRRRSDKDVPDLSSFPLWPDRSILIRGEEKTLASLPKWLWPCPECEGTGAKVWDFTCPACKGSGRRGPMRPPALWWWDVLEGVRCWYCKGDGVEPNSMRAQCCICKGTGWLSHPHDFLMLKRIAKAGEAAYEWLVLTFMLECYQDSALYQIEPDIWVHPAAEWARAVVKE